ncbi:hypothetical protein FKM82_028980 [Ascaphus truei]
MEKLPKTPLTSPGSVTSSRGPSVPGSPSAITARMDSRVLGYKDLAALPQDKAILDIERPDLMIYEPHFTYTLLEHTGTLPSRERSLSPKSISPPPSPEVSGVWAENKSTVSGPNLQGPRSGSPLPRGGVQHFHCPGTYPPRGQERGCWLTRRRGGKSHIRSGNIYISTYMHTHILHYGG